VNDLSSNWQVRGLGRGGGGGGGGGGGVWGGGGGGVWGGGFLGGVEDSPCKKR